MLTHHPSIKPWRDQPFMKYTDTQLKQALAKILPEKIYLDNNTYRWKNEDGYPCQEEVLSTELLHLCWLVECEIAKSVLWWRYCAQLNQIVCVDTDEPLNTEPETLWFMIHATWQQRVTALCKVKGIEI